MTRTHYRNRNRAWHNNEYGYERARAHIEAARRLSLELGGTDKDVKAYFFSLSPRELVDILDEYGLRYGREKRNYAEQTIAKWRSGRVQMSGMVAERLFALLPPRMGIEDKLNLVQKLWEHLGPSSRRRLRVGLDASLDEITEAARQHIDEVVSSYKIPSSLEARFDWLTSGDVGAKQQLLNHFRDAEKTLVVHAARTQVPVLLDHLRSSEGQNTRRLAQIAKIGKHELEILLDRNASGVALETATQTTIETTAKKSYGWIAFVIIAAIILLWMLHH